MEGHPSLFNKARKDKQVRTPYSPKASQVEGTRPSPNRYLPKGVRAYIAWIITVFWLLCLSAWSCLSSLHKRKDKVPLSIVNKSLILYLFVDDMLFLLLLYHIFGMCSY